MFLAVCVELLDFPTAWYYNRWAQQPVSNLSVLAILPVVVVADEDFGGFSDERERTALSAKVLRLLQVQGRPLPLFSRIFISCKINEDELY